MKLFVSAALLLAANVSAFAPLGVSTVNKGLHMTSTDDNCEDRRTFVTKVGYVLFR